MHVDGVNLCFSLEEVSDIFWCHEQIPYISPSFYEEKSQFIDDLYKSRKAARQVCSEVVEVLNIPPSREMLARRILRTANSGKHPTEPSPPNIAS